MYYQNMMGMHIIGWVFWAGLVATLLFWNRGEQFQVPGLGARDTA